MQSIPQRGYKARSGRPCSGSGQCPLFTLSDIGPRGYGFSAVGRAARPGSHFLSHAPPKNPKSHHLFFILIHSRAMNHVCHGEISDIVLDKTWATSSKIGHLPRCKFLRFSGHRIFSFLDLGIFVWYTYSVELVIRTAFLFLLLVYYIVCVSGQRRRGGRKGEEENKGGAPGGLSIRRGGCSSLYTTQRCFFPFKDTLEIPCAAMPFSEF